MKYYMCVFIEIILILFWRKQRYTYIYIYIFILDQKSAKCIDFLHVRRRDQTLLRVEISSNFIQGYGHILG